MNRARVAGSTKRSISGPDTRDMMPEAVEKCPVIARRHRPHSNLEDLTRGSIHQRSKEGHTLAGYLRDIGWPHGGTITIHQGEDMGALSRLVAEITPKRGASIRVSGSVRTIREPQMLEV